PVAPVRPVLGCADSDGFGDCRHQDLAVIDPPGMSRLLDRVDRAINERILHDDFDLYLREEVDDVFGPAIEFGVAFLAAKTLGLGDGDSLDPDFVKRLLHLIELEGLDDRFDFLHLRLVFLGWSTVLAVPRAYPMPPAFGDDGNLNSQPPAVDLPAEAAENCLIFKRRREISRYGRSLHQSLLGWRHRKSAKSPRRILQNWCRRTLRPPPSRAVAPAGCGRSRPAR